MDYKREFGLCWIPSNQNITGRETVRPFPKIRTMTLAGRLRLRISLIANGGWLRLGEAEVIKPIGALRWKLKNERVIGRSEIGGEGE